MSYRGNVSMVKVYGTNAVDFVQEKLGFVKDFTDSKVTVRIEETKSKQLHRASITYRLKGHPVTNITTEEHRSVAKCIEELADTTWVKIERDKGRYESRRRKEREAAIKEKVEAVDYEELKAIEDLEL